MKYDLSTYSDQELMDLAEDMKSQNQQLSQMMVITRKDRLQMLLNNQIKEQAKGEFAHRNGPNHWWVMGLGE